MYRVSSLCRFYQLLCTQSIYQGLTDADSGTYLVEEDILAVPAFCCKLLQVPILANTVLQAQLLPELATDCTYSGQRDEDRFRQDSSPQAPCDSNPTAELRN